MKVTKRQLRRIIREEIGRSFKTNNNNPFSFENYEEVNIEIYPVSQGNKYHVKIESADGAISLPIQAFTTETEARHYARNKSEEIRRYLGSLQK
jgi:hypothetical protein